MVNKTPPLSITGQSWVIRPTDLRLSATIAQRFGVPEIIGHILANRMTRIEDIEGFLNPSLKNLLPDPSCLKDMDKTVVRIAKAIKQGQKIAILGDYDVDGATSTALLIRYFEAVGVAPIFHIPDRIKEGYGPTITGLTRLKKKGAQLIITVDCGINAFAPLTWAYDNGLDVIVIDHHQAGPQLPQAHAIINPNRLDDTSSLTTLAAVGVCFIVLIALNRYFRKAGSFSKLPDILRFLDLVALGTVCDVVPLTGLNRAFVKQGLKILALRHNEGLRALADEAGLDQAPKAYHLGFLLGPRINAGGRVGSSQLGVELLTKKSPATLSNIAKQLEHYNQERKALEDTTLQEAEALIVLDPKTAQEFLIFVAKKGWHPGVIGIVASRLKDRYHRPVCVIALDEEGQGKGSLRSLKGVDIGSCVTGAMQAHLLDAGGGHAMAAGLTVHSKNLTALQDYLSKHIKRQLKGTPLVPSLSIDGSITLKGANETLIDALEHLEPFGAATPQPRFLITDAHVAFVKVIGKEKNHLTVTLGDSFGNKLSAIAFRQTQTPLGQYLLANRGETMDFVGKLSYNHWNGQKKIQFILDDIAPVHTHPAQSSP